MCMSRTGSERVVQYICFFYLQITKVVGDKLSGSSKPVVLDFIFEIEQLSRMVSLCL